MMSKWITSNISPQDRRDAKRNTSIECVIANALTRQYGGEWTAAGRDATQTKDDETVHYRIKAKSIKTQLMNDIGLPPGKGEISLKSIRHERSIGMKSTNFNLIITFGGIAGIGMAIAIYRILTMHAMETTFLAITITAAVAICIAVTMSTAYLMIRVNHHRRLYRIDAEAKQIALDSLRTIGSEFDPEHARHILEVLHGNTIQPVKLRAIEKPRIIGSKQVTQIPEYNIIEEDNH